jgi:molecular chaperone IbpA
VATDEKTTDTVLHQGIAKRQWSQKFVLGEWFSIKTATLTDGLLTIKVEREIPEEMKPKVIKIK